MKVGDTVHYHPIHGEPHNGKVYTIRALGEIPSAPGDPQAWLSGKSGCVSLRHLSPAPKDETRNKDRHVALLEVLDFAKSQGFKGAEIAYWPESGDEVGYTDIEECLMDEEPGIHPICVGLYLNKSVNFQKTAIPEDADTDAEETYEPAGGLAP